MKHQDVIVAGAGPAGLAAAAALGQRDFDVLVLEQGETVGTRWRERYDGLRLNTMRIFSTLPGYRIPRSAGRYPSRDHFVAYLESYVDRHDIAAHFGTTLERVDKAKDHVWRLETSEGPIHSRYVVIATGYDAVPKVPDWPTRDQFSGELIHAAEYRSPSSYRGRKVLIVGAGVTGIELAGQIVASGAEVAVAMRTPPNIFPRDCLGVPLQPAAVLTERLSAKSQDIIGFMLQRMIWGNLTRFGVPRAPEGFATKFRRTLQTSSVDDGFVAALKSGRTRVVAPIERFEGSEVVLVDGTRLEPNIVICATGYTRGLEPLVGHLGILRDDGIPICHEGAPAHPYAPRLYFAGFWTSNSGQIRLMPIHARRIARAAAHDRERARM